MIRGDPFQVDPAWKRVYWQRAWISWKVTSSNLPQGWKFETKVLDKNLTLDTGRAGSIKQSEDLWDGIIGVRGRIGLGSGKWGIPYYLDVGTDSSTFTWQGAAGIGYRWSWIDLNLVYRYLYYDMESGKLLQDFSFYGPALGVNFRF